MAGRTAKLTALAIKHAKPGKLFDGGGLYVETKETQTGLSRRWYLASSRSHVRHAPSWSLSSPMDTAALDNYPWST